MSASACRRLSFAVTAALAFSSATGLACSPQPPPPPPGPQQDFESDEDYIARVAAHSLEQDYARQLRKARVAGFQEGYEAGLWKLAPVIILAEVIETGETEPDSSPFGVMPQTTLKVVKVAKGSASDTPFKITYAGIGPCGPVGMVSVAEGKVGDRFAFFASSSDLKMDNIIAGYSGAEIRYAQTMALIAGN